MKHWHKLALFLSLTLVLTSGVGCGRRVVVKPPEEPQPSGSPSAKPSEQPTAKPTEQPTAPPTSNPTSPPTGNPTAAPTQKPATPQWNQLPIVPIPPQQPANPDPLLPPPLPTPVPGNGTPTQPGGGIGSALTFKGSADSLALKWQADAFLAQISGIDLAATGKTQAKTGSYWGFLYYSAAVNQMFSVVVMGQGGVSSYAQPNPFGKDTPFYLARLTTWKIDSTTAMGTAIANGYKPFTDLATMSLHMLQNTPVWQADGDVSVRINALTGAFIGKAIQGRW